MASEESKPPAPPQDVAAMFDLSKKKKKKKKKDKVKDTLEQAISGDSSVSSSSADTTGATDVASSSDAASAVEACNIAAYPYPDLLKRIISKLHENNPELTERRRHTMKPPQLMRMGTKKTLWVNFQEICKLMQRSPEHVLQFILAELGTEGSIDGNQRLVIRGRYVPKYIESLLRKYISEYVTCNMCRSPITTLTRDSVSRLYFVHCQECGSSRSVQAIKSGFHAATRADRRAARK